MTELLQAIAQGVLIGSTYGLLALGMGLLYGVSGVVNFSHGDFISLGMFLCLALYSALSLDPYVSIVITVPLMMALGVVVFRFLIRPMIGHQFLMIVQLTLGLSLVLVVIAVILLTPRGLLPYFESMWLRWVRR